jgi:hypothetical protein
MVTFCLIILSVCLVPYLLEYYIILCVYCRKLKKYNKSLSNKSTKGAFPKNAEFIPLSVQSVLGRNSAWKQFKLNFGDIAAHQPHDPVITTPFRPLGGCPSAEPL